MKCRNCGAQMTQGAKYCPNCGTSTCCQSCGQPLSGLVKFCPNCGAPASTAAARPIVYAGPASQPKPTATAQTQTASAAQTAQPEKKKNGMFKGMGRTMIRRMIVVFLVILLLSFIDYISGNENRFARKKEEEERLRLRKELSDSLDTSAFSIENLLEPPSK